MPTREQGENNPGYRIWKKIFIETEQTWYLSGLKLPSTYSLTSVLVEFIYSWLWKFLFREAIKKNLIDEKVDLKVLMMHIWTHLHTDGQR